MAGNASILEDHSLLSKLDKNLLKIEKAFALISGLAIFSLMVLAVRSVGGREFFEWPLSGYVDWIMQLMPLIAILAVSYAMRDGTHIRMIFLYLNFQEEYSGLSNSSLPTCSNFDAPISMEVVSFRPCF